MSISTSSASTNIESNVKKSLSILQQVQNKRTSDDIKKTYGQIYFDFQATTPLDKRVLNAMMPAFTTDFGNAHSRTHNYGWKAFNSVENARRQIADLVNAKPTEIIFTSGATESNNLALKGIAEYHGKNHKKKHIITLQTEHKCVLASAKYLETEKGWDVTYLKVKPNGLVDLEELEKAIRDDTALISIMMVNNEIGVIQPIKKIAKIAHRYGVLLHTDAAQALGKIPIDVNEMGIDLMSMSGHKLYGPKGIGALYIRSKPRVRLTPQIHGGGQERGYRSGTLPVPLCVGFGEACKISKVEMEEDNKRIAALRDRFLNYVKKNLSHVIVNGDEENRVPGNINISIAGVEGESLILAMKEVAVSSGSACISASLEPSYVLRSIGVDEALAHTSIRFGIGKYTTEAEIDRAAELLVASAKYLREFSPLWDEELGSSTSELVWT